MILSKIIAVILIFAGLAGLLYRRLQCADGYCKTNVGPVDVQIKEEHINKVKDNIDRAKAPVAFWACVAVISLGGILLFVH